MQTETLYFSALMSDSTSTMKKKRLGYTVFMRYTVAMVAVVLLSFSALSIVISVVVDRYYVDYRKNELARMVYSARDLIGLDSETDTEYIDEDIERRLSVLSNGTDVFFLLVDKEGNITGCDDSAPKVQQTVIAPQIIQRLLTSGSAHGRTIGDVFDDKHYYHALSLNYDEDAPNCFVFACVSDKEVRAPVYKAVRLVLYSCVAVLAVSILFSYFVSRKITKPLATMRHTVSTFAKGDFSARVPVVGRNEVSDLAQVFNRMADNLEVLEKTRNDFIANVSHDLRSPMTSIVGFIDGMLNGVIPPDKHEHYLKIVLAEATRLSRLISTLLDISRIQAGERKFQMVTFNICELVRQVMISLEKRIEEKQLDVSFEADEDSVFVKADIDAIYQVVYNLCDNAVKFSGVGKKFTASVSVEDGLVYVKVFNEGNGIAPEDLPQVFERFYKSDKSRGLDKGGTGLGMYISKKIMDAHNQTISVESEYEKNCCFTITLDLCERPKNGRGSPIPES